ncbi:LOW QUALITY PROTEIN: 3-hydroxy-3-methylglutaryl-coenzyme A reductase-like [Octopus sinensis]|uniref:3-hydroxy-3-methylglutaryl coenzyme A reductase n=1 Tax=Octopus sinensis TaxID=2607531 RepID=A0A7E6EM72_9MOLL|nr:LOW QUALITY PROTEIN: 3-hydroxy-3-methylglutaryl-coenzyme A reductase-like [Octopus sinensis]
MSPSTEDILVTEGTPVSEDTPRMDYPTKDTPLTDEEWLSVLGSGGLSVHRLESVLCEYERAIRVRRGHLLGRRGEGIPYEKYGHYDKVEGACCENVIGFIPVPLGVCGPLLLDGREYMVPLATTEGCLVASVNRGCRALYLAGGVTAVLTADGMTRAPVLRMQSVHQAHQLKEWIDAHFPTIKHIFDGGSRFARLHTIHSTQAGRLLYLRFTATTGDAMGMNMVSKCAETVLTFLTQHFPHIQVISLSGNFCSDKKPGAINWGRGKSVVCEATIPASVVSSVLKTTVQSLVDVNMSKNLVGSAMAGSIGGFNAHAANVVTALFIATGQDPAQNVGSSNCITLLEFGGQSGGDLLVSCSMPSIECGTVGGGTVLPPQKACLGSRLLYCQLLGVAGAHSSSYGGNARELARVVCATVMAGELSLLAALSSGHLVAGHMRYNRSQANINTANHY